MTQHTDLSNLADIEAVIEGIRVDFLKKLRRYHESLAEILDTTGSVSDIDAAISIAHRIGGVAGTFGYTELGRIARITESGLCELRSQAGALVDAAMAASHIETLTFEIATVCYGSGREADRARTV